MLFHSTEFLLFFAAFLLLHGLVHRNPAWRNRLIVAASYLFYGWWDWRFLGLLAGTSVIDFAVGRALDRTPDDRPRRRWLTLSVGLNLGVLGVFKYLGFFLDSFHQLLARLGIEHPSWTWQVILPVGISFYTFQSLSYTVDVYRRRLEATSDLTAFLAYVSFFPQLVAGPIERATHLLPQFRTPRTIRLADVEQGVWLILWGLFKKVVVADQLAAYAELAFDRDVASAPVVLLGTLAFAGQIYGDFSGYSDVARGLARMLGFDLSWNFQLPYTATNVREFWRRWHITLSTWLRDYLYVPLGGNRLGEPRTRLNLLLTMVLGGLWHGAAWNFVWWGAWHGTALVVHRIWSGRTSVNSGETAPHARRPLPNPPEAGNPGPPDAGTAGGAANGSWVGWLLTMGVVGYGWLLFRCSAPGQLARVHAALLAWHAPDWFPLFAWGTVAWWLPLGLMEAWQRTRGNLLVALDAPLWIRALLQGALTLALAAYWERDSVPFLYFQF